MCRDLSACAGSGFGKVFQQRAGLRSSLTAGLVLTTYITDKKQKHTKNIAETFYETHKQNIPQFRFQYQNHTAVFSFKSRIVGAIANRTLAGGAYLPLIYSTVPSDRPLSPKVEGYSA